MTTPDLLSLLATGALSGTLGGLLGIGGGVVCVPVLIMFLPHLMEAGGAGAAHVVHYAVATSLATVFFTNLSSTQAHNAKGNVLWRLALIAGPVAAFTAMGGAYLTSYIPGEVHRRVFGVFLLWISYKLIRASEATSAAEGEGAPAERPAMAALAGSAVGASSGLLGIGGGSVAVPFFHLVLAHPMHKSVGTSAAVGAFAALLGTLGHVLAPAPEGEGALAHTIGFVHWPAALLISAAALITAQLGARLAARVKPVPLRRTFGVFLFFVAWKLIV